MLLLKGSKSIVVDFNIILPLSSIEVDELTSGEHAPHPGPVRERGGRRQHRPDTRHANRPNRAADQGPQVRVIERRVCGHGQGGAGRGRGRNSQQQNCLRRMRSEDEEMDDLSLRLLL